MMLRTPARLRVLYVTGYYKPAFVYGGPVLSTAGLCEGLVEADCDVTVLTTNANGSGLLDVPLGEAVNIDGVPVWYFPLACGKSYFYSPMLARALKEMVADYDLAVLDALWGHGLSVGSKACQRAGVPYVVPLRGQLLPWALKQKRLKKWLYLALFGRRYLNGAAAFHCTDVAEALGVQVVGLSPPTFVIPNAIDAAAFKNMPAKGWLRTQFGIPEEAMVLLFLGRLVAIKRADIAIDCLLAARGVYPLVHLVIVGPDQDGLLGSLVEQAKNLGCLENVHFTGLMGSGDVRQALADADLLLMPTEVQENFGMAAVEALAAGVPILASDHIPVGRWADAAGAGRVVPATSASFCEAIRELMSAREELASMGQRGRKLACEKYDKPVVIRDLVSQYKKIVNRSSPPGDMAK
jgi:glycosyltransferase involved in cell wall biosynthesis